MDHPEKVDNADFLSEIGPVQFVPADWGQAVIDDLKRITSGMPADLDRTRDVAAYKHMVEAGHAQLLAVQVDGQTIGHVIWSIDQQPDGFDVVINEAAAMNVPGIDVTHAIFAAFSELGKSTGARTLRCFTCRPGMVRKCESYGAQLSYVLEVSLG